MKTSDLTIRKKLTVGTTQIYPFPFLEYVAVLAQAGTAAPTAAVLKNSLSGSVVLARSSAGVYTLTLSGAFTSAKTHIQATVDSGATAVLARVARTSANVVTITTATEAGVAADLVGNLNLSIKVYS